jgi:hypothetical protein
MGRSALVLALLTIMPMTAIDIRAQTGSVIYTFASGADGGVPYAGLVMDRAGNLYGSASQYGDGPCAFPYTGCGTVFELTPIAGPEGEEWAYKVIYTFQGGQDGSDPSSSLIFDSCGNLYGTTVFGGTGCGGYGCGTVFELKPSSAGWQETVLYRFTGEADGNGPVGPVTLDGAGNIYGTTPFGGDSNCAYDGSASCGVVFRLNRPSDDSRGWTETVLHTFEGPDGAQPFEGVTLAPPLPFLNNSSVGPPGTLYGTTLFGGEGDSIDSGGVVFRLVPSGGSWIYQTLYEFSPGDGRPGGPLVFDKSGNLYGMAGQGGGYGLGAVYELQPPQPGNTEWQEINIYNFSGPNGMISLYQGVVMDDGNHLYGTTTDGGTSQNCGAGCGTVFQLSKSGDTWYESALYSLPGGAGGWGPYAGAPLVDKAGHVYGMTPNGGDPSCEGFGQPGCGVIFRISR